MELPALLLAALLASTLTERQAASGDVDTMRPTFIVDIAALLLLGLPAAMLVAAAGEVAGGLTHSAIRRRFTRLLPGPVTTLAAMQTVGAVHLALGGTFRTFDWPWQAVPIAAAVVAGAIVKSAVAGLVLPLMARQTVGPGWAARLFRGCPAHIIGAGLAVALAEAVARGQWELLAVAALPAWLACRAYGDFLDERTEARRRREVVDALQHGMCVVNGSGDITLWSDALERMLGCPRSRALGGPVAAAVPSLGDSELARAVGEVLGTRTPRTVSRVGVPMVAGVRVFDIRILPVDGGATLLWQDMTERTRGDRASRRTGERLANAAEAANDGLWEWDLRTQDCYFSGRWRAMLGLPATPGSGRADEWLARIHPDDVSGLKDAPSQRITASHSLPSSLQIASKARRKPPSGSAGNTLATHTSSKICWYFSACRAPRSCLRAKFSSCVTVPNISKERLAISQWNVFSRSTKARQRSVCGRLRLVTHHWPLAARLPQIEVHDLECLARDGGEAVRFGDEADQHPRAPLRGLVEQEAAPDITGGHGYGVYFAFFELEYGLDAPEQGVLERGDTHLCERGVGGREQ